MGLKSTPSRVRRYVPRTDLSQWYLVCTKVIFIPKGKLRAWRDQKCISLVGAKAPLTSAGRQNTPYRGRRYVPRTESCVNSDGPIAMVPCLHQGNIYTKMKLRAWRDQKCIPLVCAITPLTCAGRQNNLYRLRRYRAQTEKLTKLGGTYRHGTVSAPRK